MYSMPDSRVEERLDNIRENDCFPKLKKPFGVEMRGNIVDTVEAEKRFAAMLSVLIK